MIFSETKIESEKIIINILNDDYFIFNRQIYWLEKLADYDYFPNICDIDYINHVIECDYTSFSNKKLRIQIKEIEDILHNINCQLVNLEDNDVIIKNNTIIIVNMFWCIDLNIGINQDINFWNVDDNTINIERADFMKNKFFIENILYNKGINILLDEVSFILFLDNYQNYLNSKSQLKQILNYCNYIIINNKDDVYKLKSEISDISNKIDIVYSESQNIFENVELFKHICLSGIDKKILINLNITNDKKNLFLNNENITKYIKNNTNFGILYQPEMTQTIGIYGDLNKCFEINKICDENNTDFSNYLSDDNEIIDWDAYKYGDDVKEKKMHWLTKGINTDVKLPIKDNYKSYAPQISTDNNFAIDFQLYKNFFKNFKYNEKYSVISYTYFFYYLVSTFDKRYKVIE